MRIFILFLTALGVAQAPLRAQLPTITNQPASRGVWAGSSVTFAVAVSGTGPFTYQWQLNTTNLPNGIITTIAGNGTNAYSGDGGAAANASLNSPYGMALDSSGNMFIADYSNNRIRKVSTNGIITTVAGNGALGYSGDGGAATNAGFAPTSVAVDASGNLFIADYWDYRVRKVGTNGIITTIAGNGSWGYSGDGGMANNASFRTPVGVAVDASGDLYIVDSDNQRIREVSTDGVITTVAGSGAVGQFTGSYSGDGGTATNATLNAPEGAAVDVSGNLFIADNGNSRVRKVNANGMITTVAGNGNHGYSGDGGTATNASLDWPYAVAVDTSGNLFIADDGYNHIRKVSTNGTITTVAGGGTPINPSVGDGGVATNASLGWPRGVAVDSAGNLFIADTGNNRIRKVINTQGPCLALNNLSAANAGSYQVVVTGPGGSVTSSVVNLIVTTSPLIYATVPNPNGSVTLNFVGQPASTNVVLCASNLLPPVVWQPLSTNIAGADGDWQYTDTNTVSYQSRFYRSLKQ